MAQCARCGTALAFGLSANIKRIPLHRITVAEYRQLPFDKLAWHVYRVTTYGGKRVAVHVEPHIPDNTEKLWLNHVTVCRKNTVSQKRVGTWDEVC